MNNIAFYLTEKRMQYKICTLLLWLLPGVTVFSQAPATPLPVIKTVAAYRATVAQDSLKQMVPLTGFTLDLRYATTNNFTHTILYAKAPATFLRTAAANALRQAKEQLWAQGFDLKVYDAYRPHSATRKMWELVKDERYAANPAKGSNHNRGLAVDVTLVHRGTGQEAAMGTGYDNFTDTAHHSFTTLPVVVLINRNLLKMAMEANGFKALETEWWHYSWPNDRDYEVMDISLEKLYKALRK